MSNQVVEQIVKTFTEPSRAPQLQTPRDYGLAFETVRFPSKDGTELVAWLVAQSGNKLAIMTHPLYCSKYGFFPEGDIAKLVPVHVEFLPLLKNLYSAGYSVLAMDFRNHGESACGEEGFAGIGAFEWKDVWGVMHHVNHHPWLRDKQVAFISQCMGSNATMKAMSLEPELFTNVKAMASIQPISMRYMANNLIDMLGGGATTADVDRALKAKLGITLDDMSPMPFLDDLKVPTFFSQVRRDILTEPIDVQTIYDQAPVEKELWWIEGELNRFDGYNHFNDLTHFEKLNRFLGKHLPVKAPAMRY